MANFDLDALLRRTLPLIPFKEGSSVIYRADENLHAAVIQRDDKGLFIEHYGERCHLGKDKKITPIWSGIRPDNEAQAFRFVKWMEKKKRSKIVAIWIVMTASDHFLGMPLLFAPDSNLGAFDGQSVLPITTGIVAHRGALAFDVLIESRDVVIGPGDVIIAELSSAQISSTGFTYTLNDPFVTGQVGNISDAAMHFIHEPNSSWLFATIRDFEDEEGRCLARNEPNDALMFVHDGALSVLNMRGIRMYGFDDAIAYFEAIMPKDNGLYHVSDITLVSSRDWESGHNDLEIEADWAIATPADLKSFAYDRAAIEMELCESYEVPLDDALKIIEKIYSQDVKYDPIE